MRLKVNLVVVILDDSAYGMIRWKQAVDAFPDYGMTFNNPDFVKYAEVLRRDAVTRRKRSRTRADARKAFKQGGVHLVAVPIDYSEIRACLSRNSAPK